MSRSYRGKDRSACFALTLPVACTDSYTSASVCKNPHRKILELSISSCAPLYPLREDILRSKDPTNAKNKLPGRNAPQEIRKRCFTRSNTRSKSSNVLLTCVVGQSLFPLFSSLPAACLCNCLGSQTTFSTAPLSASARHSFRELATGQWFQGILLENQPSRFCFATPFNSTYKQNLFTINLAANCLAGQSTAITARAKSELYTGILAENLAKSKHSTETLGFTWACCDDLADVKSWPCQSEQNVL